MSTEPAPKRLVVEAKEISLTFETADGRVEALSNVSLQIAEGEFVSFIGPSGCGKTTMLRVVADLQQPTSGTLLVNGMTAENARLARSYGYVFQAPALFPWRTIEKNLKLPLEIMGFSASEQQVRAERAQRAGYVHPLAAGPGVHRGWAVHPGPVHGRHLMGDVKRRVEADDDDHDVRPA